MADIQTKTTPTLNTSPSVKEETKSKLTMRTLPPLPKNFDAPASPNSLNSLLARSSYRAKTGKTSPLPSKLDISPSSTKKADKEIADLYGYGYGYGPDEDPKVDDSCPTQQNKRRKFQRRNSKTPRMLMGYSGALVRETLCKLDELPSLAPKSRTMPFLDLPSAGSTDNYLNIVEDIVSHVQKRRRLSSKTT